MSGRTGSLASPGEEGNIERTSDSSRDRSEACLIAKIIRRGEFFLRRRNAESERGGTIPLISSHILRLPCDKPRILHRIHFLSLFLPTVLQRE